MSENYVLVFDKNAKVYPNLWWTGPSKKLNKNEKYSDDLFNFLPYMVWYIILWAVAYYFKPKSIHHDFNKTFNNTYFFIATEIASARYCAGYSMVTV